MTKLPIFATISNSISFLHGNFDSAVRMLLPLIAFLIGAEFLITFLPEGGEGKGLSKSVMYFLGTILYAVTYIVAWALVVIIWHRSYLNGVSDTHRVNILAMKREEWQFAGKTVLFGCVYMLVVGLAMIAGFAVGAVIGLMMGVVFGVANALCTGLGAVGAIIGFGLGSVLSCRFMLYFPAKAIGRYIGFCESFRLMKGLGMRLAVIQAIPGTISALTVIIYISIVTYIFHKDIIRKSFESFSNPDGIEEMPDGNLAYTARDGTTITLWGEDLTPTFSLEGILEFILTIPGYVLIPLYFVLVGVSNLSQTYRWVMEKS
ncbi:MAG: hypothetical protein HYS17_02830 [Micavibrio aeruginosavorus]|uniref:Uncharacterized protein n=1 Tax=Micavibrio aeruginosavorus TaxID=349221 RepID=A0A7T5UI82_9BACT|nr:MAG: hypothetical protein HYS17_02830 [Micavibrio aeruginosavorus]